MIGSLTRAQAQRQRRQLLHEIAQEQRKKEREKLRELRDRVRREVARRRDETRRAVRQCRAERRQIQKEAKELRERTRANLRSAATQAVATARDACRQRKDVVRSTSKPTQTTQARAPNAYEAKKAARIDRLRERAERLAQAAEAVRASARAIGDRYPLGQPILVGHHSEQRHRRDIARMRAKATQTIELEDKAKAFRERASSAEQNRAVSSDDPEAVDKLRTKLEDIDQDRARMVAANKAVRSAQPREALAALGFSTAMIERMLTPDPMGNLGFPRYALSNAASEAIRLRKRIEELERRRSASPRAAVELDGARIEEEDNRVRIVFDGKPEPSVRDRLKRAGFRWSPTAGAWQRHASPAAWHLAERLVKGEGP